MADLARTVLVDLQWVVLGYFLLVNGFYAFLFVSSALEMRRHLEATWQEGRWRLLGSEAAPRISILAPAYNEEATVSESVRSLLTMQYPSLEVVVINDGSSDGTMEVLQRDFELVPVHPIFRRQVTTQPVRGLHRSRLRSDLLIVDKANGGKADALNAGLNVASGELVCAIDADTLIEPDALLKMVRPFLYGDDVIAAGGTIRAINGAVVRDGRIVEVRAPRGFVAGVQGVEYTRAVLTGRLGWNRLGGNLIISGAFGLFRRQATLDAGGYEHNTVGEDMELVARLRRRAIERGGPHRVDFAPDPVAWTEVPSSLRVLARQRDRWHRGLADVLWRHRRVLLNPRYGTLGLVAAPYFFFVELLAPVIELLGIVGLAVGLALGAVDPQFALLLFLVAYGLGLVMTLATIGLDECSYRGYGGLRQRLRLVGWALVEPFGYRQLTAVWRVQGLVRYLRGNTDWGVMTRSGFAVEGDERPLAP
ncbi:MAG TPA: glycosyltransferase [Capillimicrobium sp.]|jgi:cellulose synthase/poly-beta-1,6-N-acetylglucosamine synthase-like glycosyltransferase